MSGPPQPPVPLTTGTLGSGADFVSFQLGSPSTRFRPRTVISSSSNGGRKLISTGVSTAEPSAADRPSSNAAEPSSDPSVRSQKRERVPATDDIAQDAATRDRRAARFAVPTPTCRSSHSVLPLSPAPSTPNYAQFPATTTTQTTRVSLQPPYGSVSAAFPSTILPLPASVLPAPAIGFVRGSPNPSSVPAVSSPSVFAPSATAEPPPLLGRSTVLERPYLRLTGDPDPDMVRPEFVLKRSLAHVLTTLRTKPVEQRHIYAFEQLKSIRQDLTLQRIRNKFTVHVYETHAKIALDRLSPDLPEYAQCQKALMELYDEGIRSDRVSEFLALNALYAQLKSDFIGLQYLLRREINNRDIRWSSSRRVVMLIHAYQYERACFELEFGFERDRTYLHDALLQQLRLLVLKILATSCTPTPRRTIPEAVLLRSLGFLPGSVAVSGVVPQSQLAQKQADGRTWLRERQIVTHPSDDSNGHSLVELSMEHVLGIDK